LNRALKLTLIGVGTTAALLGGYFGYQKFYAAPRAELLDQLTTARDGIAFFEDKLLAAAGVRDGLRAAALTTLGDKRDTAEHRFRTTLNSIAEGCGLREIKVDNRDPSPVNNPAGQQRLRGELGQALRRQVDFSVIRGTVRGTGTLDQVLRATAAVSAQVWVHRVESFSIKPLGLDRERYELRLAVASMFLPELADKSAAEPARVELVASAADAWRPIVEKNVFRVPTPVVVVAPTPPPAAPANPLPVAPPPPAYAEWKLTGVVESAAGAEALLVNIKTQERSTLEVGGAVLDAVFESGSGERAVFRIAEDRFEVAMGSTLDQRLPVSR
jgi:hypothetical protein